MAYQSSQQFHWHYTDLDDSNFKIHGRTLFYIIVLISVMLFVTVLFVYARWLCRNIRALSSSTTTSPLSVGHAPSQGLDMDTINNLPIVLYRRQEDKETTPECSICLGIFEDGDKVKMLPNCRHCYHSECVDKWLLTHSSCPLCRASLRVDSLV